ncbi:hypothetical protein C2G38_2050692 [Gigaspora rosea]|uniref:Uncharacterized protein n=1 Tax=Gigaspora rosea TaxID=44941 RepID=A0A397TW70_9GLOM|nr:hypothetical protein C2G38_2050692 [Gigaspora rosea]
MSTNYVLEYFERTLNRIQTEVYNNTQDHIFFAEALAEERLKWFKNITEKFYNLQVESQSGFKNLIKYLGEERKKNELIGKPTGESLDFFYLKSAIKKYNEKKYSSAYNLFRHLTSKGAVNRTGEEAIQIFSISMYYIALYYLNENDEYAALGVPQFLERCNKYSDALKVYGLLVSETKVAEIKKEASIKINELENLIRKK